MFKLGILAILLAAFLPVKATSIAFPDEGMQPTEYVRTDSVNIDFDSPTFRVLDIGNSYTQNSTAYLRELAEDMHLDCSDVVLYKAIFSGGSFKNWVDIYNDVEMDRDYYIQWVFGDLKCEGVPNNSTCRGAGAIRSLLTDYDWDLIIIHQASRYASNFDSWTTKAESGYLKELLDIIRECQPGVPIGSHIIHSYGSDSPYNQEHLSSRQRWSYIAYSAHRMMEEYGIELLIPYGTAIELLRTTSLNDASDLLEDGTHLSEGLARYAATCCYYESVFAPRFRKSMIGNTLRPDGAPAVTDTNASIAQQVAREAYENPFRIGEEDALLDHVSISIENNEVKIRGLIPGSIIQLFTITGQRLASASPTSSTLTLPLPPGISLLRINQASFKLLNTP